MITVKIDTVKDTDRYSFPSTNSIPMFILDFDP